MVNVDPVEICVAGDCLFHAQETSTQDQGPSVKIARTTQVMCGGNLVVRGESHDGRVEISSSGRPPRTHLESHEGHVWIEAEGALQIRPNSEFLAPLGAVNFSGGTLCEIDAELCNPEGVMLNACEGQSCSP